MGKLSTHILDTVHGKPAQNVKIELFKKEQNGLKKLTERTSNNDGRCDQPLLSEQEMEVGTYQLVFHIGEYFSSKGLTMSEPKFLDEVVLQFNIAKPEENYHVPLVVTPWTYSTYRGS